MSERRFGEICRKVEDALEDHIQKSTRTLTNTAQIIKGFDKTDPESERIEIWCPMARQEVVGDTGTGNWTVDVDISYIVNYGDDVTREQAEAKTSELFDLFLQTNINNLINSHSDVPDFWMYGTSDQAELSQGTGFEVESIESGIVDDHSLGYKMKATAYCRPSGKEA